MSRRYLSGEVHEWAIFLAMAGIVGLFLFLGLVRAAMGAPVPRKGPPKPPPPLRPADVARTYTAFLGNSFDFTVQPTGYYWCLYYNRPWEGRWTLQDGCIVVEEWEQDQTCYSPTHPFRWQIRLKRDKHGKILRTGYTCEAAPEIH